MKPSLAERRSFLGTASGAAAAAWITAQWPTLAAAAQHAHAAMKSPQTASFEILTAEQAQEIAAIAARIIPTDDEPGATEAGVVYFIDRALRTFASDARERYETGLKEVHQITEEMFPGTPAFRLPPRSNRIRF
jgi:gluconate 2-dehydrogenase gamma chain